MSSVSNSSNLLNIKSQDTLSRIKNYLDSEDGLLTKNGLDKIERVVIKSSFPQVVCVKHGIKISNIRYRYYKIDETANSNENQTIGIVSQVIKSQFKSKEFTDAEKTFLSSIREQIPYIQGQHLIRNFPNMKEEDLEAIQLKNQQILQIYSESPSVKRIFQVPPKKGSSLYALHFNTILDGTKGNKRILRLSMTPENLEKAKEELAKTKKINSEDQ
jgi:hypothetical protein